MANYFDYSTPEWERGKAEMKGILQKVAARRGMIAYSQVSIDSRPSELSPSGCRCQKCSVRFLPLRTPRVEAF